MGASKNPKSKPKKTKPGREALAHKVLDGLLEGCQVIGPDFRYLYVNAAAARQGRTTAKRLLGRTMMEVYPGIEETEMLGVLRECLDIRLPRQMENEFRYPDGSMGWFELRFEPVPGGVAILSLDIAERKKAELALRRSAQADERLARSEARYRQLVSNFEDVVFSADAEGRIEYMSPAVERVYGYAPAEVEGKHFSEFVHPEDLPDLMASFARTLRGAVEPTEFRAVDKHGRMRFLRSASRRRLEGGKPTGIDGVIVDLTGVHEAEEAERRSEERYRSLFENSSVGIAHCLMLYDGDTPQDFVYLDVNPAFGALTGLANVTGRKVSEVIPGIRESDPKLFDIYGRVARGGAPERFEAYVQALKQWFDVSVYSPQAEHFVAVFDVITKRKQGEESLVRFSQRLESLTGVVQDLSQARSVEAIAEVVRHAARELAGSDGATFVLRDGDQCHYVDEDAISPLWKGKKFPMSTCISGWSMLNREPAVIEDIYADERIPHDAYRPTFVKSLVMVPIRRQSPIGAIGSYWAKPYRASPEDVRILQALADSTSVALENVRFLKALEEGKARTRAIYDHLPIATYVWRRQADAFVLSDFNEAAARATKGGMAACVGRPPHELDHAPPGMEKDIQDCYERRAHIRREVECPVPGSAKPRRLVLTCGFIPPDMVILHTEDVTDQRQTEEQLKLVQRLEAIGRLAGGVAHDFNNLLSVILSYADFTLDGLPESDRLRGNIVEIKKAGQRAAGLTRQLLAFSRKQVLEPQVLSLNKVIAGIERMLGRLLGEDIDIEVHLAADLGSVVADPGQLEQVIMNLAVNARDAMPEGGKLTIETVNVDLDDDHAAEHVGGHTGRFVLLSVSDTGCGMDAETRKHIFEPFFTTKEAGKGTGLGLSTVYGIVKQSGGNVWVYSEVGQGTVFKVYLPRVDAPPVEIAPRPAAVPATGNETVLIVEDEPAVAALAERILRNAGYMVLTAAGSGDALALFEKHVGEIDLLLADVVMPQMSGRGLAERLVKLSPRLKVLYMSGYTDNAIVHHGVLEPGIRFISKPFAAAHLTRKVREVLDGVVTATGANWPAVTGEIEGQRIGRVELRELPEDLRERLRKAAVSANLDEMNRIIDGLADSQPNLAAALRRLADAFDYGAITALLG
jgi:PAS domain S-box-containing protein